MSRLKLGIIIFVSFLVGVGVGTLGSNPSSSKGIAQESSVKQETASPTVLTPTITPTTVPTPSSTPTPKPKPVSKVIPTPVPVVATPAPALQTDNQNIPPISNETVSQRNAVNKAKSYLSISAFSHDGLVAQLEYEQFSHSDAVYGADNSGANWNEQAAKKAKSYMDISAFSRGSLIDQLKYEKFSQEQAEYGANAIGL